TLGGTPWPGVRVTASDEFGVPHDTAVTDSAGRYSVLVPFGDIRVQATLGRPDNRTLAGSTVVGDFTLHVSDAASMRENVDENGDGFPDWLLTRDIPVAGEVLDGIVFVDANKDGKLQTGETVLPGATVSLQRSDLGLTRGATADGAGHVRVEGLYAGPYAATVSWEGRTLRLANVTIAKNQGPLDVAVTPATLQGFVLDASSQKIGGAALAVTDLTNGTTVRATTASDGGFAFTVLPGEFSFVASRGSLQSLPDRATVVGSTTHNVTVYPSATIALRSTLGGAPTGFVTVEFTLRSTLRTERIVTTDAQGAATLSLPAGTWDAHARHYLGASLFAFVGGLTVAAGDTVNFAANLVAGAAVGGTVVNRDNTTETVSSAFVLLRSAAGEYRAVTDLQGRFLVHLPLGTWTLQVSSLDFTFLQTYAIAGDATLTVPAVHGVRVDGAVFRSFAGNVSVQIEDPVPDAVLTFSDATRSFQTLTAADGRFSVALPPDGQFALRIEHDGYVPYDAPAASPFQWQTVPRYAI
ncbi:MAG TPA: carboxypeptidase-like regulatory domain-containing protein, partial [Thermoplasmata archaeon]|nr:carboxypeptidase-like regulatory domain-containing protein [Thermoplasmata archaeon]